MAPVLKAGDKAPRFELDSDAGKRVSLSDFASKPLVLYFYPKDDTPGCTREAQAFTTLAKQFTKAGAAVVGVSRDSVAAHCRFRDKYALSVPLLSDPDRKVHEAYGAWGEKTMYGKKVEGAIRSTFLIKDGKVARVWPSVKVDGHAEQVLEAVHALSGGAKPDGAPAKKAAAKKTAARKAAPKKKSSAKPSKSKR